MKFCKFALFLALLVAAGLPVAAQTELRFNVPFDFVVAGKTLPAGHYTLVQTFSDQNTWSMLGEQGSATVLTNALDSKKAGHEVSLVFLRQGAQLTLAEIWSSEHYGHDVLRPNIKQTIVAQGAKYVAVGAE
jgi:hypothetical protein